MSIDISQYKLKIYVKATKQWMYVSYLNDKGDVASLVGKHSGDIRVFTGRPSVLFERYEFEPAFNVIKYVRKNTNTP